MSRPRRSLLAFPFLLLLALLLAGCTTTRRPPSEYLSLQGIDKRPEPGDFEVCASAGCRKSDRLAYSEAEWSALRSLFQPAPDSPAEERARIALAVALTEEYVGQKNGTRLDRPMNRREGLHEGQLDCIAEATNTTVALLLFEREGLLRHHRVGFPVHRGFLQLKLPHNTATLFETSTGAHFAVDSWFLENGREPVIVPVSAWKTDYSPFEPNPWHEPLPKP